MSALPFAHEAARDWWGVALIAFFAHAMVAAAGIPGNDAPDFQPEGASAPSSAMPDLPSDTDQQVPLLLAPDRQPARPASVPQPGRDVAEITPPDAPVVPAAAASLDLAQPPVRAAPPRLAPTQTPEASSPIIPLDQDQSPDWPSLPPEAPSLDEDTTPNVGESDHASPKASEAGDTASPPRAKATTQRRTPPWPVRLIWQQAT